MKLSIDELELIWVSLRLQIREAHDMINQEPVISLRALRDRVNEELSKVRAE